MAALHWIQQNIEKFGGNPNQITLAGHGTGAACIDFLMSSPSMGRHFTILKIFFIDLFIYFK
jgi:carboxylesterase type B